MGSVLVNKGYKPCALDNELELDPTRLTPDRVWCNAFEVTNPSNLAMILAMLRALTELNECVTSLNIGTMDYKSKKRRQRLIFPGVLEVFIYHPSLHEPVFEYSISRLFIGYGRTSVHPLLDDEWPSGVGLDHPDFRAASLPWQDSANWLAFFKRKIRDKSAQLLEQANEKAERLALERRLAESEIEMLRQASAELSKI